MLSQNTIFSEKARVVEHIAHPGQQYQLRLSAPLTATHAQPGNFIHIQCDPMLPMRRPMSIMRADKKQQTIDILYKVCGKGTALLAQKKKGGDIKLLGPIGTPFKLSADHRRPLLIGGGVGIPPMVFLAEYIKEMDQDIRPLVLAGSESPFPFTTKPSQIMLPDIPANTIACIPLLDDWGIPSRLASMQQYAGCYQGYVTELAKFWLRRLSKQQRHETALFACGPRPMLQAVAKLARVYDLPCQIALEEYMACAVGGCAGCTVLVHTESGPRMQRVCVDGPVFEARTIYPGA